MLEPNLPVGRVGPIADLAASTLRQERLISRLTILVSLLALGLACLGLYGLMSYGVKQRTAELGLRLARGARRSFVSWMVFRESLALIGVGLAVGVPAVLAAPRLVGTMLFDVSPNDPATVIVAMLLLLTVGGVRGVPARPARGARRSPDGASSRVMPLTLPGSEYHEGETLKNEVPSAEHARKRSSRKLDRLDDAFIYKESIDLGTYSKTSRGPRKAVC